MGFIMLKKNNKQEFKRIVEEFEKRDKQRESTIQNSREVIKLSKQIIYSLHRGNPRQAAPLVEKISKQVKKLPKLSSDEGISRVAFQEYVEALCFYEFVKSKNIPTAKSLGVSSEEYLSGLCDLTGELVRKAVNSVVRKRFKEAAGIRDIVDDIYGQFLLFDFRNGDLRKKFDSIKWNLKKLEDIMYDVNTKLKPNK